MPDMPEYKSMYNEYGALCFEGLALSLEIYDVTKKLIAKGVEAGFDPRLIVTEICGNANSAAAEFILRRAMAMRKAERARIAAEREKS